MVCEPLLEFTKRPAPGAKEHPLVAIATPVYNGARFLEEAMECVQAQTYPNLVHCVLDNASSDATPAIISKYQERRVPVIRYRNTDTVAMIDNWNAALRLVPASASYFRILPADDVMYPDCIRKMVELAERRPEVQIIGCQEMAGDTLLGTDLPKEREVFDGRSIVQASLLNLIHGFPHLHCLYRKRVGDVIEQFYDPEFNGERLLALDMDAAMRVLSQGDYGFVHEPLVFTRLHGESVTSVEVAPQRIKMWSELQLIDRWGRISFDSESAFTACRRKHLRYYYRHLLLWQITGRRELVDLHKRWLSVEAALPTALDYLKAVLEWPYLQLDRGWRAALTKAGFGSHFRLSI